MILVTGSRQSGTALWKQILIAAGHPAFDEAPPGSSGGASAERAQEPSLRHGIYFATNPDPGTGHYFFPEQLTRHVMEMLPFGVTRTDRAYIECVLVTLRPLREHVAAMRRLRALEDAGKGGQGEARLDPSLQWWAETYALLRDASVRRYPTRFLTLGQLLRDPEPAIREVITWLGSGDVVRAADSVKPERRTFEATDDVSVGPDVVAVADELHDAIDRRVPPSASLLAKLDETQRLLLPKLRAEDARLSARVG